MKICVTSQGNNLEAQVDPRFGRCPYFIIVDLETKEFEAIENPNIQATGGAGIQSAQLVAGKGVEAILTGNVGPNAFQTLQAAGIKVITGVTGLVKDAIERYKKEDIKSTDGPTVPGHFGMQGSQSPGPGRGAGRGMGRGGGKGRMGGSRPGAGPAAQCVCPSCGTKVPHQTGVPCYSVNCSKCGTRMVRE
ncbi:MAG TPA: NifB/NifX family molybdenum-iron cluster-binding protein [bacterium]|nr:NifB/NifX family molybdenum-iron cluster-binding protein [bacterium]